MSRRQFNTSGTRGVTLGRKFLSIFPRKIMSVIVQNFLGISQTKLAVILALLSDYLYLLDTNKSASYSRYTEKKIQSLFT